ncbi:helix-turn-helix domain-containing protein [Streptomyces sp. NPDC047000]|uniref:helix-turn-helix domain-containing protein n=1 Tax=Streptomyces sp. NPDC047000 TaxID=3155474 RepID=UPI0033C66AC6
MSELGRFIAVRRGQLKPADLGLPDFGDRRRVPGLRREEVAQLAGISVAYLIRLEQGSSKASPQVVDALAGALRLTDAERAHLHTLVQDSPRTRKRRLPADRVTPPVRQLVDAFGTAPVILLGRRSDVLAWNSAGHALIAGHLDPSAPDRADTRPNTIRMVFTNPHTRDLYGADWRNKARDVVGRLRRLAGEYPDDPQLATLIGDLSMHSPQFATLWAEHRVRAWDVAEYRMTHPLVGELRVLQHSIAVPHDPGLRLVVVTAPRDSASEAALRLLPHTNDTVARLRADAPLPH